MLYYYLIRIAEHIERKKEIMLIYYLHAFIKIALYYSRLIEFIARHVGQMVFATLHNTYILYILLGQCPNRKLENYGRCNAEGLLAVNEGWAWYDQKSCVIPGTRMGLILVLFNL